jgi:hypothetical protein
MEKDLVSHGEILELRDDALHVLHGDAHDPLEQLVRVEPGSTKPELE